jgi:hypothetical protein
MVLPLQTSFSNGKMNTKTNIQILKQLQSYFLEHEGKYIFYQNRDSAHISKESIAWMDKNGMNL